MKALYETAKFALRMAVFALPLIVNWLTEGGYVEWAALASALLAIIDKYIHESPLKLNGLTAF